MFLFRGAPGAVRELALLGSFCAASVLVVTTAGTAQLLADEGSEALPVVYLLLAAVSIPVAWILSQALGRRSAISVCRIACLVGLGVSGVLQAALLVQVVGSNLAICTIGYVLEIILDTMFWLVAADYLPTRDLKRYTPKLAMAFAIGGVAGGVSASLFCRAFSADYLMFLACAFLAVCCRLSSQISRRLQPLEDKEAAEEEPGLLDSLQASCAVFRSFPIAGLIATSILLMSALPAVSSRCIDRSRAGSSSRQPGTLRKRKSMGWHRSDRRSASLSYVAGGSRPIGSGRKSGAQAIDHAVPLASIIEPGTRSPAGLADDPERGSTQSRTSRSSRTPCGPIPGSGSCR